MSFRILSVVAASVLAVGLSGCGSRVTVITTDSASNENASGGQGGSPGAVGALADDFCAQACATPVEGSCLHEPGCSAYCQPESAHWSVEVGAAFTACVAENPMCYISIEGCLLGELHPQGTNHPVRLEGTGFDAHNGRTVRVAHDPGAGTPFEGKAEITSGTFAFEWNVPVPAYDTGGPLMLLYIDIDGDGKCNAAVDITASVYPKWNGDLLHPEYEALLVPPLADPDFVCNYL